MKLFLFITILLLSSQLSALNNIPAPDWDIAATGGITISETEENGSNAQLLISTQWRNGEFKRLYNDHKVMLEPQVIFSPYESNYILFLKVDKEIPRVVHAIPLSNENIIQAQWH